MKVTGLIFCKFTSSNFVFGHVIPLNNCTQHSGTPVFPRHHLLCFLSPSSKLMNIILDNCLF